MSANDGVYIVRLGSEYAVAVVSAIDNLYFSRSLGEKPFQEYVEAIWGKAKRFNSYEEAMKQAQIMDVETEYGVEYLSFD
jgi:hypothetical protein